MNNIGLLIFLMLRKIQKTLQITRKNIFYCNRPKRLIVYKEVTCSWPEVEIMCRQLLKKATFSSGRETSPNNNRCYKEKTRIYILYSYGNQAPGDLLATGTTQANSLWLNGVNKLTIWKAKAVFTSDVTRLFVTPNPNGGKFYWGEHCDFLPLGVSLVSQAVLSGVNTDVKCSDKLKGTIYTFTYEL